MQACPPSSPHLSSTTDQRCASVAPPPPLLPEDLLDIVYRYRHELAFAPTLRRIEQLYAEHKAEIDELVKNMWEEWVFLDNIRALQPRIYAPGGVHHQEYLSKWYPLRLKLRRATAADLSPRGWETGLDLDTDWNDDTEWTIAWPDSVTINWPE